MKATELMVGDWVCLKDDIKCELPLKIDGVLTDDISLEGEGFLGGAEGLIRPIPITPEILEKNEDVKGLTMFRKNEQGIDCLALIYIPVVNLYYIHELQHALRLCGLNELADNFKI